MIEAELKARVHDVAEVTRRLDARAAGRAEVYRDTYYDEPAGTLEKGDRELRVRTVRGARADKTILTYKGARVDEASGSKPEHETRVEDPEAVHAMLRGLGYVPVIAFEKQCHNYEFQALGRPMLATVVTVPEIDGSFIELETQVGEDDLRGALRDIRSVLGELGVEDDDLTAELYTDAVRARRA
ncbi:adenylyl cyclase [Streptomyces eurocidicus]|uniref:Adenylate cyclase class 2 n=1 Tax=Streptomyces eurocidicus TaxID=66423 RepID=A0A2N8NXW1_STREU|nr:class IV adenylate cyclase [Streptomyces eurocidicus]MBB5119707.1 adenylate cyclase class 2 [Streptomyces eurocidicus]MBF6050731.1 class IV adenylate cyclase [Streptomyces eurocidicus]PNE33610.1 adenylyl cyclase [Streptomyces eurocidicus]